MSDLARQEQDHVRVAIRYLRQQAGTWAPLAKALRFESDTIGKVLRGGRAVTASLAFRVARLADVAIEDVLDGTYPPGRVCPHCGHQLDAEGTEEAGAADAR